MPRLDANKNHQVVRKSKPSGHMQVTAYRAGHVLGACMFEIEIAGMRLLYTGDYSRVPDRHLSAADTPDNPPHIGKVP